MRFDRIEKFWIIAKKNYIHCFDLHHIATFLRSISQKVIDAIAIPGLELWYQYKIGSCFIVIIILQFFCLGEDNNGVSESWVCPWLNDNHVASGLFENMLRNVTRYQRICHFRKTAAFNWFVDSVMHLLVLL